MRSELADEAAAAGVAVFVGYDHVVGRAARMVADLLASGAIGEVVTIDVEFREHWGGIFAAHPWLAGPWESYLGFSARGGGASGEHSHAANLWQHFAHVAGSGRVVEVDAMLDFVRDGRVDYDRLCLMNFRYRAWTSRALHTGCGHPAAAQMGAHPGGRRLCRMALRRRAGRRPGERGTYRAVPLSTRAIYKDTARRLHRGIAPHRRALSFESGRFADLRSRAGSIRCASLRLRTVPQKPGGRVNIDFADGYRCRPLSR